MENIINFRPLADNIQNRGGKRIKTNTIFRSGLLTGAAPADIAALHSMDVRYIYDFRSPFEVAAEPALSTGEFTTLNFDIVPQAAPRNYAKLHDVDPDSVADIMTARYAEHFSVTDAYKPVVKSILSQDTPGFLFHCSAGKDRTGIFGAILMMALDFDMGDIRAEYLTIDQEQVDEMKRNFLASVGHTENTDHLDPLFTVLPQYFDAYTQGVLRDHDSFDDYLESVCGIDDIVREMLQERYLV